MTALWRLAMHMVMWSAAFPVLACVGAVVERSVNPEVAVATWPAALTWVAMLGWAGWIYLRRFPVLPGWPTRIGGLLIYLACMGFLAYCALAFGMLLVALFWGV